MDGGADGDAEGVAEDAAELDGAAELLVFGAVEAADDDVAGARAEAVCRSPLVVCVARAAVGCAGVCTAGRGWPPTWTLVR